MRTPFKMKGFSGFGNESPLEQLKLPKKDWAKPGTKVITEINPTDKQIKPYINLDLENIHSNDTISDRTKDYYSGGMINYLLRNDFSQSDVGTMVGISDLASKGKLSKGTIKIKESK